MLTIFIITSIRNKFTSSTTTTILLKHQTGFTVVKIPHLCAKDGDREQKGLAPVLRGQGPSLEKSALNLNAPQNKLGIRDFVKKKLPLI